MLKSINNKWGGSSVSRYRYGYDSLRRRTHVTRTGSAFGAGGTNSGDHFEAWTYNDRNELTDADRFAGAGPNAGSPTAQTAFERGYTYDPIGNRLTSQTGPDPNGLLYYCANELNQYDDTGLTEDCNVPVDAFEHDLDGNLKADGTYTYVWNVENRLKRVEVTSPSTSADKRVEFQYDYLGRRVEKRVFA